LNDGAQHTIEIIQSLVAIEWIKSIHASLVFLKRL